MAVDFSGVTASWNFVPPNYNAGETMRATISGQAVNTTDPTTVQETWGPYDIPVTAAGVPSTVSVSAATVTRTVPGQSTNENVFINAAAGATLTLSGRVFTVSADRKSISAVA